MCRKLYLKSVTKIAIYDVYRIMLHVMYHGYIIFNLRGKYNRKIC